MSAFSFDIVSKIDTAEINNVFDQTRRELINRYDFKNTPADLDWLSSDKVGLKITGNSEWQIDAIIDIVRKKLAVRNQSQKVLDVSLPNHENNLKLTKDVPFVHGLDQAKVKQVQSVIKETYPKVKTQVQGDSIRVTSPSKDELQKIITTLNNTDLSFPVQFINYR